jgi:alkanesulfonate monooxygenase SsuD/methylene tetrahydromethanopterin reductase-like flavin-dependent oxidoreductase (luciferase family)
MTRLAGEIADGVLGYCWSLEYLRDVALPALQDGAERAGRPVDEIDVCCGYPTVASEDDSGLDAAKGQVLMFATATSSSPYYSESFAAAGFADDVRAIQERVAAGHADGALDLITDDLVDAMTVSGPPGNIHRRVEALHAAGLDVVAINPSPPGIWYPLYQGHFPDGFRMPEFSFPDYLTQMDDALRLIGG